MAAKTTIEAPTVRGKRRTLTTLSVLYAGGEGIVQRESLLLRAGTVHVGRALEGKAGIDLPEDGLASRVHATIDHDARRGTTRIVDLGSRNGLRVNGIRQAEALLEDGDVIQIGESLLMLRTVKQGEPKSTIPGLLGRSPAVQRLRNDLLRVGAADATVLLLGESGTGKEVAARSLHRASGRSGPFVAVNCSAFPPSLVESQLFGHRAGAFTGATRQHDGFFRSAEGGTLFLDEIGDLPEEQQPKLLRALEEREVIPVGATRPHPFDVRVVAATNRNVREAVRSGSFRGDLYARLAQVSIALPPLRERREDILLLLEHALEGDTALVEPRLAEALVLHDWPFNVREVFALAHDLKLRGVDRTRPELEGILERLDTSWTDVDHSDTEQLAPPPEVKAAPAVAANRAVLEALLTEHQGNVAQVARSMGRSRMQVYRWLQRWDLDPAEYREAE